MDPDLKETSGVAALVGEFYAERNREYPLRRGETWVGRAAEATLRIPDSSVAPRHARILDRGGAEPLQVVAEAAPVRAGGVLLSPGERRVLEDGDRVRVADFGFRYRADITERNRGRVIVTRGVHRGKRFRLTGPVVPVGRAPDNELQFPDRFVSRRHCELRRRSDGWWVRDLESTNGTWVEKSAAPGWRPVGPDEEVGLGWSGFRILDAREEAGERVAL